MIGARLGVIALSGGTPPNPNFVSTWDTTQAGSASDTIVLPMTAGVATVDWGDGTVNTDNTHTYASGGIKTITISGTINTFRFRSIGDRLKIIDISNWGSFDIWSDQVFSGCGNLDISATDTPIISTTSMYATFQGCTSLTTPDFSGFDTSGVTNMYWVFRNAPNFNGNISTWNTSLVTTMDRMFAGCVKFNNDISAWDVSSVNDQGDSFNGMFVNCYVFNQDIGGWNWASLYDYRLMFKSCLDFDQDISSWIINTATNLGGFMSGVTLSTANYDALLIAWDAQGAMSYSGTVNFGGSTYTLGGAAETARTSLISKWGGIIDGGGV